MINFIFACVIGAVMFALFIMAVLGFGLLAMAWEELCKTKRWALNIDNALRLIVFAIGALLLSSLFITMGYNILNSFK